MEVAASVVVAMAAAAPVAVETVAVAPAVEEEAARLAVVAAATARPLALEVEDLEAGSMAVAAAAVATWEAVATEEVAAAEVATAVVAREVGAASVEAAMARAPRQSHTQVSLLGREYQTANRANRADRSRSVPGWGGCSHSRPGSSSSGPHRLWPLLPFLRYARQAGQRRRAVPSQAGSIEGCGVLRPPRSCQSPRLQRTAQS